MLTTIQIRILVGCVVLILAIALVLHGHPLSLKDLISITSYAVTGIGILLLFWERWLWSWPIFHSWLSKQPDLRGTWRGELKSDWAGAENKGQKEVIEVYLVIRQTNSAIDVRLFSAESSSRSLSGQIVTDDGNIKTLAITYRNIPALFRRQQSPISHGAMLLTVRGDNKVSKLDGEYWTDRMTRGELKFGNRLRALCDDFDHCVRVCHTLADQTTVANKQSAGSAE